MALARSRMMTPRQACVSREAKKLHKKAVTKRERQMVLAKAAKKCPVNKKYLKSRRSRTTMKGRKTRKTMKMVKPKYTSTSDSTMKTLTVADGRDIRNAPQFAITQEDFIAISSFQARMTRLLPFIVKRLGIVDEREHELLDIATMYNDLDPTQVQDLFRLIFGREFYYINMGIDRTGNALDQLKPGHAYIIVIIERNVIDPMSSFGHFAMIGKTLDGSEVIIDPYNKQYSGCDLRMENCWKSATGLALSISVLATTDLETSPLMLRNGTPVESGWPTRPMQLPPQPTIKEEDEDEDEDDVVRLKEEDEDEDEDDVVRLKEEDED